MVPASERADQLQILGTGSDKENQASEKNVRCLLMKTTTKISFVSNFRGPRRVGSLQLSAPSPVERTVTFALGLSTALVQSQPPAKASVNRFSFLTSPTATHNLPHYFPTTFVA